MKITEKMLVDGFIGMAKGGSYISDIGETRIFWNYRTGLREDGYNPICDRKNASEIMLNFDRVGIIKLDEDVDTLKIEQAEENSFKDQIK
jgi:hypothetical protein